jgi:ferric-dicitrate binding protein FerR (iron transport regulator)
MQPHDIADQNLERLLSTAYQPEPVDAAFAQRLQQRLTQEAQALAARRAMPAEEPRLRLFRRRLAWATSLAASVMVGLIIWYACSRPDADKIANPYDDIRAALASLRDDLSFGLRPRPLPPAAEVKPLAVGASLTTGPAERRRVPLADGSILYVNHDTQLQQTAARRIELTRGEVYLEVGPRPAGESGATFVVKTPAREVTALGTRFGVQTAAAGAGVIVTQGTVKVGGVNEPVSAGQQVDPGSRLHAGRKVPDDGRARLHGLHLAHQNAGAKSDA